MGNVQMSKDNIKLIRWIAKTTLITVLLITACFSVILGIMIKAYQGGTDISRDIIGSWECVQFYKNQKSFLVPDTQEIIATIDDSGGVKLQGSSNASIFRGDHTGTYTLEGGSVMLIDMGEDAQWSCPCVFTKDGLLRLTIPEMEVVLYLSKKEINNNEVS